MHKYINAEIWHDFIAGFTGVLAPEWVKAALVLALFSTFVVVGVFAYLNRYTKRAYFNLWTISWMFYGLWLVACIGLEESPDLPILIMTRRACIGISALCMFWGSFELTNYARKRRELGFGVVLICLWSYIAAYKVRDHIWITLPVFILLASSSVFTGLLHLKYRKRYRGANLLVVGFIMWGLHMIVFSVQPYIPPAELAIGYITSAVLALFIAMGMMVQVLEQARERNETLLGEFRKGVATRRLLEQEVSVSEQKYRALFDSASDGIFLVDLETLDILEANESAHRLVDFRPSDQLSRCFLDLCPSLHRKGKSLLENKHMFDEVFQPSSEINMARPNGTHILCEGSSNLVQYNKRPVLQVHVREITERKQLEQQLRQSEKLSALGQLIAGVAHELNNPLAVIMGYAQLLAKQGTTEGKVRTDIVKILRESERAAKIVRNLLTFARPREPQMVVVDINRLVASILETHEAELLQNGITATKRLSPNSPTTMADPHQIEQVITNLLINAVHALCTWSGARQLDVGTEVVGTSLLITVADTGPGISPEVVGKIFDPFFTTKAPGKGTGLGLSISHSIIEEHRGRIWVQSERGKGAKFFVELPMVACTDAPELLQAAQAPVSDPNAGSHRLLIVDDEPGIVEVLKTVLGEDGYIVETAGNGVEAMERIGCSSYDLVISDLCMPDMDGEALYKRVRESKPELAEKIIFVTGDTVSTKSRSFLEWTGNRWFSKPFNIVEIERVVMNFLHEEHPLAAAKGARA